MSKKLKPCLRCGKNNLEIWDKVARLMNLMGFKINVESCSFTNSKHPKNESIQDTFIDLANYGVIGKLLYDDKWGK